MIRLPILSLKVNQDIAIWSTLNYLFWEISNDIHEHSPFPYTFYFGYTNGWLGYLPTAAEWQHGGYEVETVSPFTPSTAKDVTEAVLGYLQSEMRTPQPAIKLKARKTMRTR